MVHRKTSKSSNAKTILRLADLEQSRNAVLHSLGAASSQESYGHAIDEFIGWYCSETRTIGKSRSQLHDIRMIQMAVFHRSERRCGVGKLAANGLRCDVPDPRHAIPLRVKKWVAAKVFLYRICPPARSGTLHSLLAQYPKDGG